MTNAWCVRANYGIYAQKFRNKSCVAIGWMENTDLSAIHSREELYPLYKKEHPTDHSSVVIGQQVGQIARFLLEMKAGDLVITPDSNSDRLWHGIVAADPSYSFSPGDGEFPYAHRRKVEWSSAPILRGSLSVPLQNTMRSSLTVFGIYPADEILRLCGLGSSTTLPTTTTFHPYKAVLEQVLQLDDKEFEILVGHLLTALGFEGSEVTGRSGDGGVDATGELNVANLVKVKLFVQAKRYSLGQRIGARVVKELRSNIPSGGQGGFITTADFQTKAYEIALEPGFPRIGLINGNQLVDLLIEHWAAIPPEFQQRLGLKAGLVPA
jgi:restriction system protein